MSTDCIFCDIVKKEIPATIHYEDDKIVCFDDINPLAPVHILIVPKKHIATMDDVNDEDFDNYYAYMVKRARILAKENNLKGYKLLMNVGKEAGQIVFHLHLHLLGYK